MSVAEKQIALRTLVIQCLILGVKPPAAVLKQMREVNKPRHVR
jgi:hypothetical protein